jgi:hypothetical protein
MYRCNRERERRLPDPPPDVRSVGDRVIKEPPGSPHRAPTPNVAAGYPFGRSSGVGGGGINVSREVRDP